MADVNNAKQRDTRRMRELVDLLNRASDAYYTRDEEIMSNYEYDALYDELVSLEARLGVTLSNSPTINVGYESTQELPRERHEKPMLSLDKTKDREALAVWLGDHRGLLSWKMDGLTVVLTYQNGSLFKAVTRGNGEIGEVITPNARVFRNIPLAIPFKGRLILRGEAVIRYTDFNRINEKLEAEAAATGNLSEVRYKNPRNLCSGSVRQLNSEITARRNVRFYAFALVQADGVDFHNSREQQFLFLQRQGFETVEYKAVTGSTVIEAVADFEEQVAHNDVPSDGLVLLLDDIAYGDSLGTTAKFPRNAIAFKWADDTQETTLKEVEWSASRTGLINPVAVFDPVELEGTTVKRASVHNISIVKALKLGIGDRITVYKANMIIPQIAENLTCSDNLEIPVACPVCGGRTQIRKDNDTEVLICTNPECPAKKLKAFSLFVSRNAMNIDGLSEMTLEKLIAKGFIHEFADIYHLDSHREAIEQMDGFGVKSCDRLLAAIEKSRSTVLSRVLYAMGITGIGVAGSRRLCNYFHDDLGSLRKADKDTLAGIEDIGPVLAGNVYDYFHSVRVNALDDLLPELTIEKEVSAETPQTLAGQTFVITGKLAHFDNRDALKSLIESLGGRAAGSVSSKTNYLINNDVTSNSTKNRKARELGIKILSEEDFLKMIGEGKSPDV